MHINIVNAFKTFCIAGTYTKNYEVFNFFSWIFYFNFLSRNLV